MIYIYMSFELAGIIVAGVVSFFDLIVNVFGLCMQRHCKSSCCGFNSEHDENDKANITKTQMDLIADCLSKKHNSEK